MDGVLHCLGGFSPSAWMAPGIGHARLVGVEIDVVGVQHPAAPVLLPMATAFVTGVGFWGVWRILTAIADAGSGGTAKNTGGFGHGHLGDHGHAFQSSDWLARKSVTAASLVPRMALMRLTPPIAEQPLPGSRLLQGIAVSRK